MTDYIATAGMQNALLGQHRKSKPQEISRVKLYNLHSKIPTAIQSFPTCVHIGMNNPVYNDRNYNDGEVIALLITSHNFVRKERYDLNYTTSRKF